MEEFFHKNGEKIKQWAKIFLAISIIIGIATMIVAAAIIIWIEDDYALLVILAAVVGFFVAVASSIIATRLVYGFGELITNSEILVEQNGILISQGKKQVATPTTTDTNKNQADIANNTVEHKVKCPSCGNMVKCDKNSCSICCTALKGDNT